MQGVDNHLRAEKRSRFSRIIFTLRAALAAPPLEVVKFSLISAFISAFLCAASALHYLDRRTYGNLFVQSSLFSFIFGDSVGIGSAGAEYILAVFVRSLVIFGFSWGPVTLILLMIGSASRNKTRSPEYAGEAARHEGDRGLLPRIEGTTSPEAPNAATSAFQREEPADSP